MQFESIYVYIYIYTLYRRSSYGILYPFFGSLEKTKKKKKIDSICIYTGGIFNSSGGWKGKGKGDSGESFKR